MTKIEEIEQNINLMSVVIRDAQEALNKYQKALAELKESKKEGKWKPKDGEKYWFVGCYAKSDFGFWNNDSIDIWRYKTMLLFKEKQECERYKRFMDTVKEKSYSFSKEEWEDTSIIKYFINYNGVDKEFGVDCYSYLKFIGTVYFKTEEDAKYIIDNFKDELMEFFVERG